MSSFRRGSKRRSALRALARRGALAALIVVGAITAWRAVQEREPALRVTGPEVIVFDWSKQACEPTDYPDLPTRALRDSGDAVTLTIPHMTNRRLVGPDFDRLSHPCGATLKSHREADPDRWNDREWVASTWTPDGTTVYALLHNEYQGRRHPGRCPSGVYQRCWWNAVTHAVSTDGGRTFMHATPPRHVVLKPSAPYMPDAGPVGVFAPSNIVRSPSDGWLYALVHVEELDGKSGVCLIRTRTPGIAPSWQTWRPTGFEVPARRSAAACELVAPDRISTLSSSLTWNTELDRYVLVGTMAFVREGEAKPGVWYATSENLHDWSVPIRILEAELPSTYRCGDPDPIAYPSLIDPDSGSRNFDVSGRRALLYFTRMHYEGCRQTEDRDLVRVPVEIGR